MMRAAVLHQPGADLVCEDVALDDPGPHQATVRLAAGGVCHSDLSIKDGTIPHGLPAVLGHEGSGIVEAVGEAVTLVAPGDHVVLTWISPCRECHFCLFGQPELCERGMEAAFGRPYGRVGGRPVLCGFGTGTFAEQTVVPETALIPIPAAVPLDVAALAGCAVATGVGAVVNSAGVKPGSTVAVIGCGGVGLAAIQGARLAGAARIIAIDRVGARLALALENGATDTVDATRDDDPTSAVRQLTDGIGVDHALEVVGSSATIMAAYAMARRGGCVTVVGAGRFDDPVTLSAMQLMVDAKTVRGCLYGATDPRRDIPRLLELDRRGSLDIARLISHRIRLDEVNAAFTAMVAGEGARSVIMF